MSRPPWYATREQCAAAFDVKTAAWLSRRIDRIAEQASRALDDDLNRFFYPVTEARTYSRPPAVLEFRRTGFWLDADLLSLTSVTIDGTTVTGVVAGPLQYGTPYSRLDFYDADLSSGQSMTVTGRWGYTEQTVEATTLAAAISSASATTVTVADASMVGVGDGLMVDDERFTVTDRAWTATGTTLSSGVDAQNATTALPVADGTALHRGETVAVDTERMLVVDVVGNTATVRRAVDGSVLAAHSTAATVYAQRLLTVTRGEGGTTATAHLDDAPVLRHVPPPLITELVIAEVQSTIGQEQAGWNLTIGEGEGTRESMGKALGGIRKQAWSLYRRTRIGRTI